MRLLRNLYRILSPRERRQVLLLTPLLCLTALVEVVGIASITPFLAIVADPGAVERHQVLARLYSLGGFTSSRQFLIALGALMFLVIVGSNALTAVSTWAVLRFSWMRNHSIALRLLRSYLDRPYVYFLARHSSDLAKNLVAEVHQVVAGTIVPVMKSAAKAIAAVAILGLLFAIDPWLAALTTGVLGGAYALVFLGVRRSQLRMGKERLSANKGRFEVLAETFGGIKEVKLLAREDEAMRRFSGPSFVFARATARNAVVAQIPRYALEAVAFGGIVLIVLYVIGTGREFGAILPILGLYAFAGYRLMPALQQIFQGLTNVRFNSAALDNLIGDLVRPHRVPPRGSGQEPPLRLTRSLRFRRVSFRYPSAPEPLFEDLDLEITAGTSTALVGETGSGKSTLGDLVLGLLRPDSGWLEVDGTPITEENLRRWQRNLGYVPQSIFLTDDTVARNIAFGLPDDRVDMATVERAARAASIDAFIRTELPQGYETVVGERGVRLSGGQRQRIGIARALYHDPEVLVLDEATSSLDGATEESVLQAIAELARTKTLIMIAHRLTTVQACDRILLLSGGRVLDTGAYDELLTSSPEFRALAGAGGGA